MTTTTAARTWDEIRQAERVARHEVVTLMVTFWDDLSDADKAEALHDAWTLHDAPLKVMAAWMWQSYFEEVGQMYDREAFDLSRAVLPEKVMIYRGGVPQHVLGLSWTLDQNIAQEFVGFANDPAARVFRIVIDREDVNAYFTERNETEVVVNAYWLEGYDFEVLADDGTWHPIDLDDCYR